MDGGDCNPKPNWCHSNIDNHIPEVQLPNLKHDLLYAHHDDRARRRQHGARAPYGCVHENVRVRHVPSPGRLGNKRWSKKARQSKRQSNAIFLISSCVRS